MGCLIMSGHCPKCKGEDLLVQFDYKRYDICIECRRCGFFGEIITDDPFPFIIHGFSGNYEEPTKALMEVHFRKVIGSLYSALRKWGLLPVFVSAGYARWLNDLRLSDEMYTYYLREGYIKKTSQTVGYIEAIRIHEIYYPPLDLDGVEVGWLEQVEGSYLQQ